MTIALYVLAALAVVLALGVVVLAIHALNRLAAADKVTIDRAGDLSREQIAHERDRQALAAAQASVTALRETVAKLEQQVMVGESEVRRLRLAVSPADRADAMGAVK